jgi:hypothetical protein
MLERAILLFVARIRLKELSTLPTELEGTLLEYVLPYHPFQGVR